MLYREEYLTSLIRICYFRSDIMWGVTCSRELVITSSKKWFDCICSKSIALPWNRSIPFSFIFCWVYGLGVCSKILPHRPTCNQLICRYVLFWFVVGACKFAFSYFLQVWWSSFTFKFQLEECWLRLDMCYVHFCTNLGFLAFPWLCFHYGCTDSTHGGSNANYYWNPERQLSVEGSHFWKYLSVILLLSFISMCCIACDFVSISYLNYVCLYHCFQHHLHQYALFAKLHWKWWNFYISFRLCNLRRLPASKL